MLGGARRPEVSALDDEALGELAAKEVSRVLAASGRAAAPVDLPVAVGDRAVHRRSRRAHRRHPAAGRRAPRAASLRHRLRRRFVQRCDRVRSQDRPRHRAGARSVKHIVLVTYGEPITPAFVDQLVYSWRILLGLTRTVADIPAPLIPADRTVARARPQRAVEEARLLVAARADHAGAGGAIAHTRWRIRRTIAGRSTSPTSSAIRCCRR